MLRWKGRSLAASLADSCDCCTEPLAATAVNRRRSVAGVAAAGIAASGFAPKALAQAKPHRTNEDHVRGLSAFFNLIDMKAIDRDNALRFIPRLKAA
jgi:hypothetical protein